MKGIMDFGRGELLPYSEVVKKLGISKEYILSCVCIPGNYVFLDIIKKEDYDVKGNVIKIKNEKLSTSTIIMKGNEFSKRLGIDIKNMDAWFYLKEGDTTYLHLESNHELILTGNTKNIFLWIYENNFADISIFKEVKK